MEPSEGEQAGHRSKSTKSLGAIMHGQASKVTALEAVDDLYKEAMVRQRKLQNPMREHSSECERHSSTRTCPWRALGHCASFAHCTV